METTDVRQWQYVPTIPPNHCLRQTILFMKITLPVLHLDNSLWAKFHWQN